MPPTSKAMTVDGQASVLLQRNTTAAFPMAPILSRSRPGTRQETKILVRQQDPLSSKHPHSFKPPIITLFLIHAASSINTSPPLNGRLIKPLQVHGTLFDFPTDFSTPHRQSYASGQKAKLRLPLRNMEKALNIKLHPGNHSIHLLESNWDKPKTKLQLR